MKIETIPTGDLTPYARNARTHSPEQVDQICASIAEFGFTNPLLVSDEGMIIAGHGRLMAAEKMGLPEVPAIRISGLSEEQRRALTLADNRIAQNAGWDEELLRVEISALQDSDYDLALTGFDSTDIDEILGGPPPKVEEGAEAAEEEAPAPPARAVSRAGDLWLLGRHRVLCGDATSADDIHEVADGQPVACVWTDPPYGVAYDGGTLRRDELKNDHLTDDDYREFLLRALTAAATLLRKGGGIYLCYAGRSVVPVRQAFDQAGFHYSSDVIWAKGQLMIGGSDYQCQHECMIYGWRRGANHRWFSDRKQTTLYDDAGEPVAVGEGSVAITVAGKRVEITGENLAVNGVAVSVHRHGRLRKNTEHPTMKPPALIANTMINSTIRNDLVLDPFGGSGSTLIACEAHERRAALVELDPKFVDVIVARWQALTGQEATLAKGGQTFAKVKAARLKAAAQVAAEDEEWADS